MFGLIFNCLECFDHNRALILPAQEIATWPPDEIAFLKKVGILAKAAPARITECPGCEELCSMEVMIYSVREDKPAFLFISCDKRDDIGFISITPSVLGQWQINVSKFAGLLSASFGRDKPREIIPQQAFYLGLHAIKGKRRSVIFVIHHKILDADSGENPFDGYPYPVFLVAAGLKKPQTLKQGRVAVPLQSLIISSDSEPLLLDMNGLEYLISDSEDHELKGSICRQEILKDNIFRRVGPVWMLRYDGKTINLNHLKGLLYISYLLGSPYQEYHVAELIWSEELRVSETSLYDKLRTDELSSHENPRCDKRLSLGSGKISTPETIQNYKNRIREIDNELLKVEQNNDSFWKQKLIEEKKIIAKELRQTFGGGGRLRDFSDETKKQAKAVSEAIRRSMKKIQTNHPSLWRHLYSTINSGEILSYTPDTDTSWITI